MIGLLNLMLPLLLAADPAAIAPSQSPQAPQTPQTSCTMCHMSPDLFDAESLKEWEGIDRDVHHQAGLSCQDCHGGNPDPALSEDAEAAMDPNFTANPFRGAPLRTAIPAFCGRCHSDPVYMKRFRPDPRIDQEQEYWTSRHGKALRTGDINVATCIDCHGTHRILPPDNPEAPVYPTHVAETCGRCHSDPEHMKGYRLDDGRPLPVDQYARWSRSVHANALLVKGDLTAPTCNDCHGNHGATPPGVKEVALVCGQCHGREANLFRASPKQVGFQNHNDFLAEAGDEGCASCHDADQPPGTMTGIQRFYGCVVCHENHGVVRPTIALLSPLPDTPCALCHEGPEPAGTTGEPEKVKQHFREVRDALLAKTVGMAPEDRFDWLVDQALVLDTHTLPGGEGEAPALRPEFARLFERFRIGKTHYTFVDPETGTEVKARVRRCGDCHAAPPDSEPPEGGFAVSQEYLDDMHALTLQIARAERSFLAAQRGGVEVREALTSLDSAVDSQIQLEVLVHGFSTSQDGAFVAKQKEGMAHAQAAAVTAQRALEELTNRRRGLGISLIFILIFLTALGLKIRDLSRP